MLIVWQRMERKSSGSVQLVVCHTHHPVFELGFEMSIVRLNLVLLNPVEHRVGWFVVHALSMAQNRGKVKRW